MARAMKDSGIEWIGAIPEGWNKSKLKYVCNIESGEYVAKEDYMLNGEYDIIGSNGKIGTINKTNVNEEVITTGRVGSIGTAHIVKNVWVTDNTLVLYKKSNMDVRYLAYIIPMFQYDLISTGTAQPLITATALKNQMIPFVELEEQKKIADFLDDKVGEVNTIVSKTKESIEEYKKYRNSLISEKIIFGMDSSVPMKKSGVDWCPKIPEHWNVINPKALFTLRKEKAKEGDRQLTASQKKGIMYQDEYMEAEGVRVVVVQKDFDILKHVEPDDFVISMRSFQGGLEYSELRGCISSAYVMLIPNKDRVYSPFYKRFFKSSKYINAIQSTSNLVRDGQAMRYSNFAQVPLLDIPLDEQKEIANYLDAKCTEIDALIAKKEVFVKEMEAYKKSLIYEYVTGKKEV